jgi:hypothetical protein
MQPTGMPKQALELPHPSKILLLFGTVRIFFSVVVRGVVVVVVVDVAVVEVADDADVSLQNLEMQTMIAFLD